MNISLEATDTGDVRGEDDAESSSIDLSFFGPVCLETRDSRRAANFFITFDMVLYKIYCRQELVYENLLNVFPVQSRQNYKVLARRCSKLASYIPRQAPETFLADVTSLVRFLTTNIDDAPVVELPCRVPGNSLFWSLF